MKYALTCLLKMQSSTQISEALCLKFREPIWSSLVREVPSASSHSSSSIMSNVSTSSRFCSAFADPAISDYYLASTPPPGNPLANLAVTNPVYPLAMVIPFPENMMHRSPSGLAKILKSPSLSIGRSSLLKKSHICN